MNRKSILLVLLALGLTSLVAACGGGSHKQQIIVAMTTPPPSALEIKIPVPLAATVTNDKANGGVNWSLACDTGADCGTLSSATSASGTAIVYTAPATIPEGDVAAGGMVLNVTATSATDSTTAATATVIIFPISDTSLVAGSFAFVVSGSDVSDNIYSAAGSVTLDGAGNVMSGEEDYNNAAGITSTAITVTGGTYTLGQDGQGTITLDLSDPTVGVAGVQTLAVTFVNLNHARVIQFDDTATSSGSLDFQTFTAGDLTQITGGYALEYNGVDVNPGEGLYVAGGVATADGAGNFTPMTIDENVAGNLFIGDSVAGAYSAPDANGRGTSNIGPLNFAYYIVNSECLRIVDIDAAITTAGSFYGQGSSAGTFTNAALGTSVFTESGSGSFGFLSTAGQLTLDGSGNITAGFGDANEGNGTPTNGAITGTYALDATGRGTASLTFTNTPDIVTIGVYATDPTLHLPDPNSTAATGPGGTVVGSALIVDLDADAFATGFLTPQFSSASFFGNYAVDYQAPDLADLVGQVFSDGTANLTGSGSLNDLFFTGQNSQAITATFAPDAANPGRSTVTAAFGTAYTGLNIAAYQATDGEVVFVEIDPALIASGVLEGQ